MGPRLPRGFGSAVLKLTLPCFLLRAMGISDRLGDSHSEPGGFWLFPPLPSIDIRIPFPVLYPFKVFFAPHISVSETPFQPPCNHAMAGLAKGRQDLGRMTGVKRT